MAACGVVVRCELRVLIDTLCGSVVPFRTIAFSELLRISTEFQVCCM